MLLCGCVAIGLSAVKQLDRRVCTLRSMIGAVEFLEKELAFRMLPMRELLLVTGDSATQPASDFLKECVRQIDVCETRLFSEIWSLSADEMLDNLKAVDREIIDSLGTVLGRFDVEGQRNALQLAAEQLKRNLANAVEERGTKGAVYRTVGMATGIFMAILLL